MPKKGWIIIAILAAAVAAGAFFFFARKEKAPSYRTAAVTRGDLAVQVTATGTLNPFVTVQVGTQVSGTVARLFADFNSRVKKGQVVALLDTLLLHAAVVDARAALVKADAQASLSSSTSQRTRALFAKGLVAQADLDQAVADSISTATARNSAQAALDRAKVNLGYATIRSPITGVVINRAVDVGQTVAASFNTPTIFTIADDLARMQVQASIDEADIGQVKTGQVATFTVDAYPTRTFSGTVSQIRLQPTTVQNVVSYTVMIDVENADMALLPGMTANVTIEVQKAHDVVIVPVAALKFTPPISKAGKWRHRGKAGAADIAPAGRSVAFAAGDSAANKPHGGGRVRVEGGDTASFSRRQPQSPAEENRGHVFVLVEDKPKFVRVKTGLSNGGFTAVEGDVKPGDQVIVGVLGGDKNASQQGPFGMGGPPGMGRRF
jgi:HlyD family secretion protein